MRVELTDDPTAFMACDWTDATLADPGGTFFHTPAYLKLWWEEFGTGRLAIAVGEQQGERAGACCFQIEDGLLTFLGGFDVTDYMGPVARPGTERAFADGLMEALAAQPEWERADLRGLPADQPWPELLQSAAASRGFAVEPGDDGAAPVLALPETYEEYLSALPSKLRHEIRRKERRLRANFGDYTVEFATEATLPEFYDRFIDLHKQSPGPKGKFLHAGMEIFFRRLGEAFIDQHVFHLGFIEVDGVRAAGFIGFGFKDTFSLYNSAFDREHAQWSPGMVLIADMIEMAIRDRRSVFDFLKGDLDYKNRFGPKPRPFVRLAVKR
ncbi:MAG TPA: GNAT family N-acetyltransferase [Actinomycetota bacterium]|jgi:CelD/BcsL family acetyltransferase involved in cellulose biosynthesis